MNSDFNHICHQILTGHEILSMENFTARLVFKHSTNSWSSSKTTKFSTMVSLSSVLFFRYYRFATASRHRKAAATENPLRLRHVVAVGWETATDFRHGAAMAEI